MNTRNAFRWTKRNGELVNRAYLRRRAMQKMRHQEYREFAIAATIDNDAWLKGKDGMLVEAVVDAAWDDGFYAWVMDKYGAPSAT